MFSITVVEWFGQVGFELQFGHCNNAFTFQEQQIITAYNPVHTMKCCKTAAEIEGMKLANINDAVALCRYFHWLETEVSIYYFLHIKIFVIIYTVDLIPSVAIRVANLE